MDGSYFKSLFRSCLLTPLLLACQPCSLGLLVSPPEFTFSSVTLRTLHFLSCVPSLSFIEHPLLRTALTLAQTLTPLGADGDSCSPGFVFPDLPGYLVCCLLLILENSSPLSLQIFLLPPSLSAFGLELCAPGPLTLSTALGCPFFFLALFAVCFGQTISLALFSGSPTSSPQLCSGCR